ncbi:MAG: hypothetical protein ACPGWS_01745, partial [Solirubrobacterales bacterium]
GRYQGGRVAKRKTAKKATRKKATKKAKRAKASVPEGSQGELTEQEQATLIAMFESAFDGKSWGECAKDLNISRRALFKRRQNPKLVAAYNAVVGEMLNGEWPRICGNMAAIATGEKTYTYVHKDGGESEMDAAKPSEQISAAEWVRKVLGKGGPDIEVNMAPINVQIADPRLVPADAGK